MMIFNLFKKKEECIAVPTWEEVIEKCFDSALDFRFPIEKVIYSDSKDQRGIILKRDKIYEVIFEKLRAFDEDELRYLPPSLPGYWEERNHGKSLFDSAAEAEIEVERTLSSII